VRIDCAMAILTVILPRSYGVIAEPDVQVHFKLSPPVEFLVLACDGMWTRHSEASCVEMVRRGIIVSDAHATCQRRDCVQPEVGDQCDVRLCGVNNVCVVQHGWTLDSVAKWVIDDVVHNKGCQDNVTMLIVRYLPSE